MSMNFLAILISFAMMLTGAGADGQSAEASRTLVLHNISVTYNDETVTLEPSLRLGAYTDGEKAVFDIGLPMGDETLFPFQLGVDKDGVTLLHEGSDVAVRVSEQALNALSEQAAAAMKSMTQQMQSQLEGENGEVLSVLTNDFLPAYAGLMEMVKDADTMEQFQQTARQVLDEVVDRGEGRDVSMMIEGENYDLTGYNYTIEGVQLGELADKLYASNEKLSAFSGALFKLYGVLPEESGLNDVKSFKDLFEKFGIDMRMDMDETVSEDGEVEIVDAVMTVDLNGMVSRLVATKDGEPENVPEIEPIVMNIHSSRMNGVNEGVINMEYNFGPGTMTMDMTIAGDDMTNIQLSMDMAVYQDDAQLMDMTIAVNQTEDRYDLFYDVDSMDKGFVLSARGARQGDGKSTNSVDLSIDMGDEEFDISFEADVTDEPFEDKVNGHEAYVIEELSQEGIQALQQDQTFAANIMQVAGAVSADFQKLTADEDVQQAAGMFALLGMQSMATPVEDYDYSDDSFGEDEDVYEYEEPEDDGVLPFEQPEFTWLPEGWEIVETNVDTAYDMVEVQIADKSYDNYAYAVFNVDYDTDQVNYLVNEDGSFAPVEGREVTVTDYGDGSVYVSMRDSGVYTYLSLGGQKLDMDTVSKIVSGIKF